MTNLEDQEKILKLKEHNLDGRKIEVKLPDQRVRTETETERGKEIDPNYEYIFSLTGTMSVRPRSENACLVSRSTKSSSVDSSTESLTQCFANFLRRNAKNTTRVAL